MWDIFESKKVADRHAMSKLCIVMEASIKDTCTKSWAVSPFKFQGKNLMADDFLSPGFVSMSPGFSYTWVFRIPVMLI